MSNDWSFPELEHFLSRGQEKVFWFLTYITGAGLFAGFLGGQRVATLGGITGPLALLCGALGGALGVYLTSSHNGIMRLRRWWLMLYVFVRRISRPRVLHAETLYAVVVDHAPPVRVRARGGGVVLLQRQGTRRGGGRDLKHMGTETEATTTPTTPTERIPDATRRV